MKRILLLLAAVFTAAAFAAPEGVRIDDKGILQIGPARFYLTHFAPGWHGRNQNDVKAAAGFPRRSDSAFELTGEFGAVGAETPFRFQEKVDFTGKDALRYTVNLSAPKAVPTVALFLSVDIPAGEKDYLMFADADEIALPEEFSDLTVFRKTAKKVLIVLPGRQIEISGDFQCHVQDNRRFRQKTFSIRLSPLFTPDKVENWNFSCNVKLLPPLAGERLPAGLAVDPAGSLKVGEAEFAWILFDPDWRGFKRQKDSFRLAAAESVASLNHYLTVGEWLVGDKTPQPVAFREELTAGSLTSFRYRAEMKAASPVKTNCLTWLVTIPAGKEQKVAVDGKEIVIPEKFKDISLFRGEKVKSFRFETGGKIITIEGDFGLHIQDDRKWREVIQFRILPAASSGSVTAASLDLGIRIESPRTLRLDLSGAANMGFRDDRADDGQGGWTDQGAGNDLRMIKPGMLEYSGVGFRVIDPASNGGKSCIVVSGGQKKFPVSATVPVKATEEFQYLYLLHASAWTPKPDVEIGKLLVDYADGGTKEFPIVSGKDCGNWWEPTSGANSAVVWTGENAESFVGLYLSQFPVGGKVTQIRFVPEEQAVWMVVGATLGDSELALKQLDVPAYFVAGDKWIPVEFDGKTVEKSPLDFSRYLDAPAGKYGSVIVDGNGHFAFRDKPQERIRFFGPNLVGSGNYLTKELADEFVTKMVRLGYNSVRFHHFENGLLDTKAADSLTFNPEALDQINYLFAELKKKGIYLCIDLYASRKMKAGDNVEEMKGLPYTEFEMKVLAPVSPTAMANWKAFARKLLSTRNPYTGMTWGEDPALYSLNLINEAALIHVLEKYPPLQPLYDRKFVEYLKARNMDTPENRFRRDGLYIEFLNQLQADCIAEQKRFLQQELKLNVLVTDLNYLNKYSLAGLRGMLDFVDNHQYWDHPQFPERLWNLPHRYGQGSSIQRFAANPRGMMPTRIFGLPFTVTEYNFCNPNIYRIEAAPLLGGYAGLQDWDGLYRFAWSHSKWNMEKLNVPHGFDIVNDPQAQLAERIIRMLFLRGDVAKAEAAYAFEYSAEQIPVLPGPPSRPAEYPVEFSKLGLYGRIGSLDKAKSVPGVQKLDILASGWEKLLPAAAKTALDHLEKEGKITSVTGQIELDTKTKAMSVVTPMSEVITLTGSRAGKVMSLKNADCYQTAALLTLDDKPFAESRELLFIHLTNLAGNKQKFGNNRLTLLQSFGELPIILERGKVEVELKLPAGFRVEALKLDGSSNGEVSSQYREGKLAFTADTAMKKGGVMVYRLSR